MSTRRERSNKRISIRFSFVQHSCNLKIKRERDILRRGKIAICCFVFELWKELFISYLHGRDLREKRFSSKSLFQYYEFSHNEMTSRLNHCSSYTWYEIFYHTRNSFDESCCCWCVLCRSQKCLRRISAKNLREIFFLWDFYSETASDIN